jgi:MFS transporter, CP family, cyanate transporter
MRLVAKSPSFEKSTVATAGATGIPIALFMLFLVATNLRTGLIGVGPLMPDITDDLDLSKTSASFLVALPPLLMGIGAVPGGRLADRWGARATITLGLAIVAIAGGLRAVAPSLATLLILTTLFGAGVGIAQPALPRLCRGLLPQRMGFATGVYAGGFFAGALLAAFLTGPVFLSGDDDSDWRLPLAVWGGFAAITLAVWMVTLSRWSVSELPRVVPHPADSRPASQPGDHWTPWRDRSTWIVAGVFAGQGLAYYLLVAWLPTVYEDLSISKTESAVLFAVFNLATFPAMVGLPILSDHIQSRRIPTLLASCMFLLGSTGLAIDPAAQPWRWVWPVMAGFGLAGLFGMGLLMPADTARPGKTGQTAGMVLAIGYVASGLGPVIGGAIQDVTGSFEKALALLPVLAVATIILAWHVPQPRTTRTT